MFLFIAKSKSQSQVLGGAFHLRRAARGERGARAARVIALQLAPPSPIAARAERADAPAPAAARAPMMMRGLGPFFSVVQGAVTVTQVFGSHVAISGLAIFRYGLA